MINTRFKLGFTVLFLIGLSLPLIQNVFEIFPRKSVSGFSNPIKPTPNISSILDFSFQKEYEQWFHRKHGFWGYLVRLNNQLNFELFGQISSGYKASVLLGKDDFLFEQVYLASFNHLIFEDSKIDLIAEKLSKLADLLHKRGKHLVLTISASKIELHPEYVQEKFIIDGREIRQSEYEKFIRKLSNSKVKIVDSYQDFKNDYSPFRLKYYNKSGAHWNELGACINSSKIISSLSKSLNKELQNYSCDQLFKRPVPSDYDMDLVKIANLWSENRYSLPVMAPKSKNIEIKNPYRPKVMIVGTSFVWALLKFFKKHHVFQDSNFYYYFKRKVNLRTGAESRLKPEFEEWKTELDNCDALIFEINQSALQNVGFEFLDKAISYLNE